MERTAFVLMWLTFALGLGAAALTSISPVWSAVAAVGAAISGLFGGLISREAANVSARSRHLSEDQANRLRIFLRSDEFRTDPPQNVTFSSVEDAEARMFAMELQNLFQSEGVNIYPTDGGLPQTVIQLADLQHGLVLVRHDLDVTPESQPVAKLQRFLTEMGWVIQAEIDPQKRPAHSTIAVMKKPKS